MDDAMRERLEQELRFLKESYEAEVISKEEYEKGRERIEKKLQGNENTNGDENNEFFESQEPEKKAPDAKTESKDEVRKEVITPKKEPELKDELQKSGKEDNKALKYAVVFAVLTLIVFFGYSLLSPDKAPQNEKGEEMQIIPACISDMDCVQDGKQGICIDPSTKNAKCQYQKIKKTKVTVLNGRKGCFNCDTARVLGILENWFGDLDVDEIDYNSEKGKELADKFEINILPAYILESDITNKTSYNQIKQTFVSKGENYMLSENAAGSTFYFRRENIPNKLDLFAREVDGTKAKNNLKEFLEAFPNAAFEKHLSTSDLAKELGFRTFPAFLVNNRVKFTGVHPAEAIKDNFCSLNKLEECKKELSANLI